MSTKMKRDRQLKWLPVDKVVPNERNPRKSGFSKDALQELTRSIQQQGILEPVIVQPYEQDLFVLIEGERRWTVAKNLGLKEIPAVISNRLEPDDQVVVMYNLHENRKGWEMADHLRAIQELLKNRPQATEEELATELGISLATLRNRLQVLDMGPGVVQDIERGKLDYTSALRSSEAARTITRKRPVLAEELGGVKAIEKQLIVKAKEQGGLSHELLTGKRDLADTEHVPDDKIKAYVEQPALTLREIRRTHKPAQQAQAVNTLERRVLQIEEIIREVSSELDLATAPNLRKLRTALRGLASVAEELERKVVDALLSVEGSKAAQPKPPAKPPRRASKCSQQVLQGEADERSREAQAAAQAEAGALVGRVDAAAQEAVRGSVEEPRERAAKRKRPKRKAAK